MTGSAVTPEGTEPSGPELVVEISDNGIGPRSRLAAATRALGVLLVEDHSDTARQLTRLLKRAGHEVRWAGSVREAQECAASSATDSCPAASTFSSAISACPMGAVTI